MIVVVRGGTVVRPGSAPAPADVVIDDGVIAAVTAPGAAIDSGVGAVGPDLEVIDAGGLVVLPGGVDPHVHFDEPGRADWEGFDSGTAAAAAGGVTTVVDMPIDSDPPTITAALVEAKVAAAERSARVDVAIWGGLVPAALPHLHDLLVAGVVGFKAFACPSGWDDFPAVDEPTLRRGLEVSARCGRPVALHAELADLGHTPESEVAAVAWAGRLAAETGGRLHIVHVSAADAVDEARRWPGVTVETCPHYLGLTVEDVETIGREAWCAPPIRDARNRQRLWDRVLAGSVDCLASDHSPCPTAAKQRPDPWLGITGVETGLSVLLDDGRLPLDEVARLTTAAAEILRLPGKGRIEPGFDGDLALVDPEATWTVEPSALHNRHQRSPWTGRTLRGRVVRTLVRGRTVFDLDHGPRSPGGGRVLRIH